FSSVWMAFDQKNKEFVAIKIHNIQDYDAGVHEAKILKTLKSHKSKHVIKMLDHYIYYNYKLDGDHYCIVMEIMACSLLDLINKRKWIHGLPTEICIRIVRQCLLAISELNESGYIHTDIKPENILFKVMSQVD